MFAGVYMAFCGIYYKVLIIAFNSYACQLGRTRLQAPLIGSPVVFTLESPEWSAGRGSHGYPSTYPHDRRPRRSFSPASILLDIPSFCTYYPPRYF